MNDAPTEPLISNSDPQITEHPFLEQQLLKKRNKIICGFIGLLLISLTILSLANHFNNIIKPNDIEILPTTTIVITPTPIIMKPVNFSIKAYNLNDGSSSGTTFNFEFPSESTLKLKLLGSQENEYSLGTDNFIMTFQFTPEGFPVGEKESVIAIPVDISRMNTQLFRLEREIKPILTTEPDFNYWNEYFSNYQVGEECKSSVGDDFASCHYDYAGLSSGAFYIQCGVNDKAAFEQCDKLLARLIVIPVEE